MAMSVATSLVNKSMQCGEDWGRRELIRTISQQSSSRLLNISIPRCSVARGGSVLQTCRICKQQFDPAENHVKACRFHTAHYGGETKRKFESVYKGGTMNTPGSGEISHYWHCCGNPDPFDLGCETSPHLSYDD